MVGNLRRYLGGRFGIGNIPPYFRDVSSVEKFLVEALLATGINPELTLLSFLFITSRREV